MPAPEKHEWYDAETGDTVENKRIVERDHLRLTRHLRAQRLESPGIIQIPGANYPTIAENLVKRIDVGGEVGVINVGGTYNDEKTQGEINTLADVAKEMKKCGAVR